MAKTLLIVDDSSEVRKAIKVSLEYETDFSVCAEAVDGLDAIEKARNQKPDLIVLDLSMPRMNGLEAARVLRLLLPATPLVLFTMYAEAVPPAYAKEAGFSAVFSKGDIPGLIRHVTRTLRST